MDQSIERKFVGYVAIAAGALALIYWYTTIHGFPIDSSHDADNGTSDGEDEDVQGTCIDGKSHDWMPEGTYMPGTNKIGYRCRKCGVEIYLPEEGFNPDRY